MEKLGASGMGRVEAGMCNLGAIQRHCSSTLGLCYENQRECQKDLVKGIKGRKSTSVSKWQKEC